jgi:deoxycytidine triphosphate deaminase
MNVNASFPSPGILSDGGIRREIRNGNIRISEFEDSQIQPSSLDLRIGKVKILSRDEREFPDEQGIPIDLPSKSISEIYFHENIFTNFPKRLDLRSSRGRLGLEIIANNKDSILVVNNNPNTIRLYGRTPFAQMIFHSYIDIDGYVVNGQEEAERIGKALGIPTLGPYALFQLGEHAYRFKHVGTIDTKKPCEDNYEKLSTANLKVPINETFVCQLAPRIDLPADIGIQVLHKIPFLQESGHIKPNPAHFLVEGSVCNAGWVDPGYKGNITAHIRRLKLPGTYQKGDDLALGVFFKYYQPVERPYGHQDTNNHYSGSAGSTSRS